MEANEEFEYLKKKKTPLKKKNPDIRSFYILLINLWNPLRVDRRFFWTRG